MMQHVGIELASPLNDLHHQFSLRGFLDSSKSPMLLEVHGVLFVES